MKLINVWVKEILTDIDAFPRFLTINYFRAKIDENIVKNYNLNYADNYEAMY